MAGCFSITTLGCKVNQYESCALAAALAARGMSRADGTGKPPDLAVVNTCCVTAAAMRKSRQAIRRCAKRWPDAAIVVTGCYADYDGCGVSRLLRDRDRAVVCGHHGDIASLLPHLAAGVPCASSADATPENLKTRRLACLARPAPPPLPPIARFDDHQRAFVKVQDGCDAFCSYCVVPYTRPLVRSRGAEQIEAECRALIASGHKEIVLCGVFLGAFGQDTAIRRKWNGNGLHLSGLLRRVASIEGLWRVRLSSIEPLDVTDDLLAAFCELRNAAPHFHLPLQSGSDRILRRMNRQYSSDDFLRTVSRLRETLDSPAITTDVIVGFPGESEDDFARTLSAADQAGFAKIHAFPFSPVAGTAAWRMRRDCPPAKAVKERLARLLALESRLAEAYRRQFVGKVVEGLVEDSPSPRRQAITDRYLTVFFEEPTIKAGQVVSLKITGICREGLIGQPCKT